MRDFVILCICGFVSRIAAAPGYQYAAQMLDRQPHPQYGVAPEFSAAISNELSASHAANVETNFRLHTQNPLMSVLQSHASYLTPAPFAVNTLHQPQYQHTFQQQQYLHPHQHSIKPQTIISKRFYLHTAPEDDDDDETSMKQHYLTIGKSRKNYNIVFIKSPDKAKSKTTLKITPAVNEEKTVIYVLNKKHEATDIEAEVHEPISTTAKPEVYFIKYKTADEAAHAQHTIQAQYDALGGSTSIINEGVGLQSSVIGSLDVGKHAATEVADTHERTQSMSTAYAEAEESSQNTLNKQSDDNVEFEAKIMDDLQHSTDTHNGYLQPVKYYRR